MNRYLLGLVGATAMLAVAPAAHADNTFAPGSPQFVVTGNAHDPNAALTATLSDTITTPGAFTDTFEFTLLGNGLGSGSLTTSASVFKATNDLDFTSILVNGQNVPISKTYDNLGESALVSGFTIKAGVQNTIVVNGLSRGNGSYGGNATFTPTSVPETATWAMMILGFGVVGAAMRRRRKSSSGFPLTSSKLSFA